MSAEPRYLLRRLVAIIVDVLLVNAVIALMMAPLIWGFGPTVYRSQAAPIHVTRCQELDELGGELGELLTKPTLESLRLCHESAILFPNGHTLEATYREAGSRTKYVNEIPVRATDDGRIEVVAPTTVDSLLTAPLLVVLGALFLGFRGGKAPGKALLGLRVTPAAPAVALRREGLKLMPLLIVSLLTALVLLAVVYTGRALQVPWPLALGLSGALGLFLIWYYVVPFFTGDHRARWDRAAGTRIERVRR